MAILINNRNSKMMYGAGALFILLLLFVLTPSSTTKITDSIANITPQDTDEAPTFERVGGIPLASEEKSTPSDSAPIVNSNEDGEIFIDGTVAAAAAVPTPGFLDKVVDLAASASASASATEKSVVSATATGSGSSSGSGSGNVADKISSNKPFYDSSEGSKANVADKNSKSDSKAKTDKSSSSSSSSSKDDAVKSDSCTNQEEYVVMIDAGSTGSRVHIYKFDVCFSPPKLLNEEFNMLNPGLSSFDTDTKGAAASLDPLLELALKSVPKDKQGCTPVAVKATAGLRLLGQTKSDAILKEVRRHLEEDYPFAVVDDANDGISIMDGSDEGVYAWITTNYLLGNIGSSKKTPTAAVFDLGGGSTQIVFEPVDGEKMINGEHKYEISFGGRDFVLYQYSHLGYGLMQGRRRINAAVITNELERDGSSLTALTDTEAKDDKLIAETTIQHPCLPPGVKAENVKVEMEDKTSYLVNFVSPAKTEDDPLAKTAATQCRFLAEGVLNKELECESKSCSFNGIYQPSLKHQFLPASDMFVFSYFYDRLQPIGMPLSFTLDEMKSITQLVCAGSSYWNQYLVQPKSIKELEEEPLWCLDLSFMTTLLHTGYDIPLNRELKTAKKIEGNELGWCLGASLPLLDKNSGWKCKVSKGI